MGRGLESALAILNGLVGDHLARTHNGLVTPMAFMHRGEPVLLTPSAILSAHERVTPRVVVLVHGLMVTETVWEFPDGGDYGSFLARDAGFTPFYVRYNTGLPIVDNGQALARLLDALVLSYPVPVEEILLLGYSMGGLLVRSACHEGSRANSEFLPLVQRAIYVGTPHLGAPYERIGRAVSSALRSVNDPVVRLVGDIANLRSAGLQDLGDADLRHEDRVLRSTGAPSLRLADWRHPVPLLPQVKHHLVAGSLSNAPWLRELFGDSVVPLKSALAGAGVTDSGTEPKMPVRILSGLSHVALAHDPLVYEQIKVWAAPPLAAIEAGDASVSTQRAGVT